MRWAGPAVLTASLILSACGNANEETARPGAGEVLADAEHRLAEVESGWLHLRLAARAGTGPVGFDVEGPFAYPEPGTATLPVLDFTYTRLLGAEERVTAVRSTGDAAFVEVDDVSYALPEDRLHGLEVDGARAGLGALGVAGWLQDPELSDGGEIDGVRVERVRGGLDVVQLLGDLAEVDRGLGGAGGLASLDDLAAARLQRLVRTSDVEVLIGAEDGILRRVEANASLTGQVPVELEEALGPVSDARLEVLFELEDPGRDVDVLPPVDVTPLPG